MYDFWYVARQVSDLKIQTIIDIFQHYMKEENSQVSRAEFEKNLLLKQKNPIFINDIKPLLSPNYAESYQLEEAYKFLFHDFLPKLIGEPWKGIETN